MDRSLPVASSRTIVPRARRHAVSFDVTVRGPTTPPFGTSVRNLSSSGMLIDDAGPLAVDDAVFVDLPELGAVLCRVVRLRGGSAGVKFVTPIRVGILARS